MLVQINTDGSVGGDQRLIRHAEAVVTDGVGHFAGVITRVEVHLSDENSDKKGGPGDKRCLLEARLANQQPIAVSHQAATVELAIDGALEKLENSLTTIVGRRDAR